LAERVDRVVKSFASAPQRPPAPPARVHVVEAPRAPVAAPEPVLATPRVEAAPAQVAPVPRLELALPPRAAASTPDRTLVERVRREAPRVSREREPAPRAGGLSLPREAARGPARPQVERLRIEPEALRRERGGEPLRASTRTLTGMREVARERQSQGRERPELRRGQDDGRPRQGSAPRPQRERGPRELSHPERPRR
jgi:hypothetical protein